MSGRCGRALQVLHDEFLCKNFGFNFPREDVFYTSQWAWPRFVFVLYRVALATYSLTVLVYSIIGFDHATWKLPWPVWLTNWSYLILTIHLVLAAVLTLCHSRRGNGGCCGVPRVEHLDDGGSEGGGVVGAEEENLEARGAEEGGEVSDVYGGSGGKKGMEQSAPRGLLSDGAATPGYSDEDGDTVPLCSAASAPLKRRGGSRSDSSPSFRLTLRWYFQLDWILFAVSTTAALLVTLVYFAGLYPSRHVSGLSPTDANLHMMNSVMVALEFCVSAMPVRLLHFVYVWAYGGAYVAFSAVYWATDRNITLYPGVLDWNHPETTAVVLVVIAVAVIPLLVTLLFGAYRLRLYMCRRIYGV